MTPELAAHKAQNGVLRCHFPEEGVRAGDER